MNKEDLDSWKHHPVTEKIFKYLDDVLLEIIKEFSIHDFSVEDPNTVARIQAQISGKYSLVQELISIEFEDINQFYNYEKENEVDNEI